MNELQPEEMLLTVAATITEEEMGLMVSNSELSQLIIKEPVLSKVPKCTAEGCWYGIVENEDKTLGSCPVCLGRGVVANTMGF